MIGVHPSEKGRGLGSKLLRWGLERADAEGVEVFLSASPEGRPMYEKYGFRAVNTFAPYPGYEQVAMIRSPNGR
jgi:ribosomal protein S18 acetylase RimI-like enzyme